MGTMKLARVLAILACVTACGRDIPPTEVVVSVDAEDTLRGDIDRVQVRVLSSALGESTRSERLNRDFGGDDEPIRWPLTFQITPLGHDATRTFELLARAYDGKTEIGRVRALTGFVAEETRYLMLTFTASCRVQLCGEGETCAQGACVDADVDTRDLDPRPPKPATGDGDDAGDGDVGGDGDDTVGDGDACTGTWDKALFGEACWGE